MGNSVTVDLKANNEKLNKTLKDSEGIVGAFGKTISTVFYTIQVAQQALAAGGAIVNWAAGFIQAAAESQEAEEKLGAVLESTGHAAGFTKEQLVGLSASLQDVTKFEAETTQEAMGIIATFKNIRGDIFIDATKAAQDMATVLGTDLKGASMQLGKALNDPVAGLNALKRSGVSFTEAQEDMINAMVKSGDVVGAQKMILAELSAEFGGAAEKVGQTFGGKMEIFKNRLGDIAEDIGFALMPIVEKLFPIAEGFADIMEQVVQPVLEAFVDWAINTGTSVITALQPTFQWLGEAALNTFTAVETVLYNFGAYWQLTIDSIALGMVKWVNDTVHFFTDTIPTAIKWYVDTTAILMTDGANFVITVIQNMLTNIYDFIKAVASYMQGDGFDFKMTGLLKGFQATLLELPQFAERAQTETEKILQEQIDNNANKIGEEFNRRLEKNREVYDNLFKTRNKEFEEIQHEANMQFDAKDFTVHEDKKDKKAKEKKEKEKETKSEQGQFVGLEELNKRIAQAAGKQDEKELQKQAMKAMEKLIDENQVLIKAIGDNVAAVVAATTTQEGFKNAVDKAAALTVQGAKGAVDGVFGGINDFFAARKAEKDVRDFKEMFGDNLNKFDEQVIRDEGFDNFMKLLDDKEAAKRATDKAIEADLLGVLKDMLGVNKAQAAEQEKTNKLLPDIGGLL